MKSISLKRCQSLHHDVVRHSPDGFNMIIECHRCMAAWQIMGVTGEEILLPVTWMERVVKREKQITNH